MWVLTPMLCFILNDQKDFIQKQKLQTLIPQIKVLNYSYFLTLSLEYHIF